MVSKFNSTSEFAANTYLITKNDEAILIDVGFFSHKLKSSLENINLKGILLTHGHFDHIKGLNSLLKIYPSVPLYCGEEDDFLKNPLKNGSLNFNEKIIVNNSFIKLKEKTIKISDFTIDCFFTPGHSDGSFIFYIREEKAIFFGDTVIEDSYGRYDLYSGSFSKLKNSLERIKYLPFLDDDICYFGHGEEMPYYLLKRINRYI